MDLFLYSAIIIVIIAVGVTIRVAVVVVVITIVASVAAESSNNFCIATCIVVLVYWCILEPKICNLMWSCHSLTCVVVGNGIQWRKGKPDGYESGNIRSAWAA